MAISVVVAVGAGQAARLLGSVAPSGLAASTTEVALVTTAAGATALKAHLDRILDDATIPELPNHYRGKVRDNYDLADGRRIIIATDRLSAFDRILTAIPFKGQVLTQIARFWFEATADLCPNHVLSYPDPNVLLCRR